MIGGWYRFEDPVLQLNNKMGNTLELKINSNSTVEKVKMESNKEEQKVGFLKPVWQSEQK